MNTSDRPVPPPLEVFHYPADFEVSVIRKFDGSSIHLWLACVNDAEQGQRAFLDCLGEDERVRARGLRHELARREFVLGRGLLRSLLAGAIHCLPSEIDFRYTAAGKPVLAAAAQCGIIQFSVSHSGGHVAIALARRRRVGVDIELMDARMNWMELAHRIFSNREIASIQGLPAAQRREAFFQRWTCKEALLKATGSGLIDDLSAIEFDLAEGRPPTLLRAPAEAGEPGRWTFHRPPVPDRMAGSLAVEEWTE